MEEYQAKFNLTITKYAKHRGVSHTAVQNAIDAKRLTEDVSFVKIPTPKRFKCMFNPVAADAEWEQNTTVNGNNIHSIAGENKAKKTAPKKKKNTEKKKPTPVQKKKVVDVECNDDEDVQEWQKFSSAEMKQKEGFYKAEREKVKLHKELSVLVEYEHVEFFYKQMVIAFKQKILQVPGKLKLIIGKENSEIVKEELRSALEEIAKLTIEDFEKEGK